MAYAKIRPRRGTAYEWSTYNPILAEGELAIETPDGGVGTGLCKFKLGNGISHWNDLPYAFDGSTANSIDGGTATTYHIIQLRRAAASVWFNANPILSAGEIGYDTTNNTFKIGDGVKRWNELSFIRSSEFVSNVVDFGDEDGTTFEEDEMYVNTNEIFAAPLLPSGWDKNIVPVDEEDTTSINAENLVSASPLSIEESKATKNDEKAEEEEITDNISVAGLSDILDTEDTDEESSETDNDESKTDITIEDNKEE